ncbi:O-antigen ligase family protein [Patescibacteria group bacterium]|nr:O-antigen ligase family protein [Patescibacteria group bacterium]
MQKKLEYLIKILIGATFFVPLIVLPGSYIFPFIVPKIIWFRTLVMLMLGVYILLLSSNWQKYRPRLNFLNIAVLLFYLSFGISTFTGVDWYRSFWDNHERMLGLFTITHYVLYYFITTSVVKGWDEWKWFLRVFLLAGGIVMFIGFLQRFVNPELLLNHGAERVSATLGNSIYYSGYGLFLFFSGLLLVLKENDKLRSGWFWFAFSGSFLGFLGIFLGGTRGALLGLLAGLGVLTVSYLITVKGHKKIRLSLIGLMVLGVILLSCAFIYRQTNFVSSIPAVGQLVNSSLTEGSGETRMMAWGVAIDAWQERPIFGWGPNNYYYAFNKYYRAEFLEHGYGETWFDNAHSVVMNTLATQGVVGIVTYLGIFWVAIFMLWRGYKKGDLDSHIISIGSAFLVAHLVSLVTVFDNPTSYLYFFFFLAFLNNYGFTDTHRTSLFGDNSDLRIEKNKNKNISTGLAVVVGIVVLLMIFSTNINPAKANKNALIAIKNLNVANDVEQLYTKASSTPSPHIDDIRNDFSRTAAGQISNFLQNKNYEEADKLFVLASDELKKNLDLHPLDIRVNIQLSQLALLKAQSSGDMKFLFEAEKYLEDALVLSPKRQQIQYTLSALKLQLNKPDEAIKILQESINNDPKISEGWWRLGLTYFRGGQIDQAQAVVNDALGQGIKFNANQQQAIDAIMGATSTVVSQ